MIRPYQLRMARAALGWTVRDLAEQAQVSKNTISRYETGKDAYASSLEKVERVLRAAGVIFFEDDGSHGTGVGLSERPNAR